MLALFLKELFFSAEGGLKVGGVPVVINGSYVLLYAELHIVISDGDGLRAGYCWKGAGSLKPCIRHHNVLMKGSDLVGRCANCTDVEITCEDPTKFKCATNTLFKTHIELVAQSHQTWKAGNMTKDLFEKIEKSVGFFFHSKGLPFTADLDELDVFTPIRYDWVHSALQDGCMTVEMHLIISSSASKGHGGYPEVQGCRIQLKICWPLWGPI